MHKKLDYGETTIESMKIAKRTQGGYAGRFSVRLYSGELKRITVTAPTVGDVRRKAHSKADEILEADGREGTWTPKSSMSEYMNEVSLPAITNSTLRDNSKTRYIYLLGILSQEFANLTIRDSVRFRRMETALKNIAKKHGTVSAEKARNVLSKWVLQQLIRDEVITGNPLAGMSIDLGQHKKTTKSRGGKALTQEEWERVLDYLFSSECAKVKPPKRGKYTTEDRATYRRAITDITLLQAATGLRINEVLTLTADDVKEEKGKISVHVSQERSKTHRARTAPILDERVAKRLGERMGHLNGQELVFSSPAAPERVWDASNVRKLIREFYVEIAKACDVPLLMTERTHIWRPTLNTIAMNRGIPAEMRAAYFGHTVEINKSAYTDTQDVSSLVEAFA